MIVGAEEDAGRIGEAGWHPGGPCRQKTLALHCWRAPDLRRGEVAYDAVQVMCR